MEFDGVVVQEPSRTPETVRPIHVGPLAAGDLGTIGHPERPSMPTNPKVTTTMGQIFDDYRRVTNELLRVNGLVAAESEFSSRTMAALRAEQDKVKAYQTERQRFEEALKKVTDEREAFRARAEEAQRLEDKVKRQDGQIKRLKAELRAALAELLKGAK